MASWIASGPGRSMQKFSACKKRAWLIQRRRSTNSVCMIAICPVGPPKEMKPSFSQNRNASANEGNAVCCRGPAGCEFIRTISSRPQSKLGNMNTPKLFTMALVSAGLAFGATAQGHGKKHHEEQEISSSDVPAAVQQAPAK